MPTYEYACKGCGEHFDVVQSFHDEPLTECAVCGGELRKVFGSVGIVFKGSGFYKTDSRTHSTSSKASEPAAAKSDSTESAPAAKTESKPADSKPASTEKKATPTAAAAS